MTKSLAEDAVDSLIAGEDLTVGTTHNGVNPTPEPLLGHNRSFSKEHIDRALAEYRQEFPAMCRDLAITPQMIAQLDTSVLMATILLRMWRIIGTLELDLKTLRSVSAKSAPLLADTAEGKV